MGAYRSKKITKKEYFAPPDLYKFETIEIYGPENGDAYLTDIYIYWRELPPVEKQYTKHDYEELSLEKSFL